MIISHLTDYKRQCNLFMNFDDVITPSNFRPSDCDLWIIGDDYEIFVEIKNESNISAFTNQKFIYERAVKNLKFDKGISILVVHQKYIENGDESVNVGEESIVSEYYMKALGKWVKPKQILSLNDFLRTLYWDDSSKYTGWAI